MSDLTNKSCKDLPADTPQLTGAALDEMTAQISSEWSVDGDTLTRRYKTKGFAKALMLVNGVGYLAEAEDHHPDIKLGYGYAEVSFTTHSVGGLSENDFICAAKLDAMFG
ncbi:4a-hydroxytetrahydrobiopterin dehydratase [Maritimibacter sp. UBA3975]|uniref:4a-hydroxytetrahydrobiopterin dehydratase n=1 Tax=Maritimibacter sp. UBA3975 TaxID=1946833 RepID=UPI000C0A90CD|nr:4a-hydroxytetrahydrobiopterin dehydratase [Maritimibacter sp. UBA3975]MAM60150.1 pterin-4-alpha-carbinolamine dehydratase [Maritimibacter sp.]|tara:strand:+ start:30742 stop:31071 length:330 start_codon:yes stop_codon:yes gene_type:complete